MRTKTEVREHLKELLSIYMRDEVNMEDVMAVLDGPVAEISFIHLRRTLDEMEEVERDMRARRGPRHRVGVRSVTAHIRRRTPRSPPSLTEVEEFYKEGD